MIGCRTLYGLYTVGGQNFQAKYTSWLVSRKFAQILSKLWGVHSNVGLRGGAGLQTSISSRLVRLQTHHFYLFRPFCLEIYFCQFFIVPKVSTQKHVLEL